MGRLNEAETLRFLHEAFGFQVIVSDQGNLIIHDPESGNIWRFTRAKFLRLLRS